MGGDTGDRWTGETQGGQSDDRCPLSSHYLAGPRHTDTGVLAADMMMSQLYSARLHYTCSPAHLAQAAGAPLGGKTFVDCQV